jgi:hypothetical protein
MVKHLKTLRYFIFSSNLSTFDLFWITLLVHFMEVEPLVLLAFIPLIFISSYMKVIADKQDEEFNK